MPSVTQPWLHLASKNARMLTGSRFAGKKCSQSRKRRGKRCWFTSRTLPQAQATPFEQLGARPSRPPAAVPTSIDRTYAPKSNQKRTVAMQRGCMRASKLPPALRASKQPRSNKRPARSSLIRACSCSVGLEHRALLNPEHRHRHCPQCPDWVASHGGA